MVKIRKRFVLKKNKEEEEKNYEKEEDMLLIRLTSFFGLKLK